MFTHKLYVYIHIHIYTERERQRQQQYNGFGLHLLTLLLACCAGCDGARLQHTRKRACQQSLHNFDPTLIPNRPDWVYWENETSATAKQYDGSWESADRQKEEDDVRANASNKQHGAHTHVRTVGQKQSRPDENIPSYPNRDCEPADPGP